MAFKLTKDHEVAGMVAGSYSADSRAGVLRWNKHPGNWNLGNISRSGDDDSDALMEMDKFIAYDIMQVRAVGVMQHETRISKNQRKRVDRENLNGN